MTLRETSIRIAQLQVTAEAMLDLAPQTPQTHAILIEMLMHQLTELRAAVGALAELNDITPQHLDRAAARWHDANESSGEADH